MKKLITLLVATLALALVAFTPDIASAGRGHGGHGWHGGRGHWRGSHAWRGGHRGWHGYRGYRGYGYETHVVARTGTEGLGQWFNEERDVYRDYGEKIGGPLPTKIVRVWLIAVSLFQHTEGKCQYANISFVTDDGVVPVL